MSTKRIVIDLILLALIAYVGRYYIAPTVMCWREGGVWAYTENVCHMGTYDVSSDDIVNGADVRVPVASTTQPVLVHRDILRVNAPLPGEAVSSPLILVGSARGPWFFEASFPIRVLNEAGAVVGEGHAEAVGEWMTTEYVPFKASVSFSPQKKGSAGTVVFLKDNPSGLEENDDSFSFPITF